MDIKDKLPKNYHGEIEIEVRNACGDTVLTRKEPNIVKIYAKEILSNRAPASMQWDHTVANGDGTYGAWVPSGVDPFEEFSLKYICFGASYDDEGFPLDVHDPNFYQQDPLTGLYRPINLTPGATHGGGLIKPIPINEDCARPLKRVENFSFDPTYQPAGTPYLHDDVRAMRNILVAETTLRVDEYNGFNNLPSEYFTITEIALCGGKYVGSVPECNIDPHDIFIEGPYEAYADGGTNVVTLTGTFGTESISDVIGVGDIIKLAAPSEDPTGGPLSQTSPYYLVTDKGGVGELELVLDRVPRTSDNESIAGDLWVYRDSFRIFSHRILNTPIKKSSDFEIIVRWSIIFS